MNRAAFGYIVFVFLLCSPAWCAGTLTLIAGDGPSPNRLNFVIVSEGYKDADQGNFLADVGKVFEGVFSVSPYSEYRRYFNCWAVGIASAESGADHPLQGISRNTYFDATFGTSIERLVTISGAGYTRVFNLLAEHVPDYDIVCVLVNDGQYGGSGGAIAVATTNESSVELVLHEVGHSFPGLADEYEYGDVLTPAEEANVTAETNRARIRWNGWIEPSTPVPTPKEERYFQAVGLFEGAMYKPTGWYRPKYNCKMRSLNIDFCEVCRETHIAAFYSLVSPIDRGMPGTNTLVFDGNGDSFLSVRTMAPEPYTMRILWFVNGNAVAQDGDSLDLRTAGLRQGGNTVSARIIDGTDNVRIGANLPLLGDTCTWTVDYRVTHASGARAPRRYPQVGFSAGDKDLTVDFSNSTGIAGEASLFNCAGRRIVAGRVDRIGGRGTGRVVLAVGNLPQGFYVLVVKSASLDSAYGVSLSPVASLIRIRPSD